MCPPYLAASATTTVTWLALFKILAPEPLALARYLFNIGAGLA